ncbi:tetratricopeptide repeat protein [Pseudomonas sp. R5(2019)]|uniref:tetratricopeptide repeat protein n=1 Tax=Pseudomonas sp. R5(2019) TaxID=2697566 RepID=UPI0014124864|nr:tetratricopeptide repeat protein [Pseudomonas sp. R5(2019)]NBA98259.1 sel1 repeat family protein [Pseudomonas sp. R5(2019)]
MSAASNIYPLLEHLLPARVLLPDHRPTHQQRLLAGIGLPSQQGRGGESFPLATWLDEEPSVQTVYRHLRKQALKGDVDALNDLGWVWLNGKYWRDDPDMARQLLRMAALQGHAVACLNLGQQHYFGKGGPVDYARAAECYAQAFERGLVSAAAALGDLYEEEVCVDTPAYPWPLQPQRAYRWFYLGAQEGDARCRFEIGLRLLHGQAVARDRKAGEHWLELAAQMGVMQAAEELALHFHAVDRVLAYLFWRDRAIALGSQTALDMKLADQLRP